MGFKKYSNSLFLGYEKTEGVCVLGLQKWSYSKFSGYNFREKFSVFVLFSMVFEFYEKKIITHFWSMNSP